MPPDEGILLLQLGKTPGGVHSLTSYQSGPDPVPLRPGGAASEAGEVSVSVQQLVQLTAVGRFDLEEPGFTVGIGVHQLGGIGQRLVDGNDLTTDRRV